jgi:glucokinase
MQVLSGDIGGTKTRVALMECAEGRCSIQQEKSYASSQYHCLEDILRNFLLDVHDIPTHAGFGIAGPIRDNRCDATNLPWRIDAASIAAELGIPHIHLTNDLAATAWGINALQEDDLLVLHPGCADDHGNVSVVAAGTGLGQAGMYRQGRMLHPFASEGGHADFAPSNELEFALLQFLSQRHGGHVSWERVVSGIGIANIYQFLCHFKGIEPPAWLHHELQGPEAAKAISIAADAGRCPLCEKTMDLFVRLYAREIGNHALKIMATGGVYIGGGIAPKIIDRLKEPRFLDAFFSKGRMEPLMRSMPMRVILDDKAALYGAAIATIHAI